MIAYYANPYDRRPFWRERADDGRRWIFAVAPEVVRWVVGDGTTTALRPPKTLSRHLILIRRGSGTVDAVVYLASDDSEAHWRIFLLVAAVAIVVAIKHFVEKGAVSEEFV